MNALRRDQPDPAIQEPFSVGGGGRTAGAVIGDDLVLALGRDQDEAIAADSGHGGLDDTERRGGGNGGIDCVAASAQRVDGNQGCQGVRSGGCAALRDHRGAPRLAVVALWLEQGNAPSVEN